MTSPRLPWRKLAPQPYASLASLGQSLMKSTLGPNLVELVQTRVSQINGCAFCVDMHVRDLRKGGEAWQRLNLLSVWRETAFFTPREQAALAWAESLTTLADGYADRNVEYAALQQHFSEQEIVELSWVVASMNAWNRLAVGMHEPIAERPIE